MDVHPPQNGAIGYGSWPFQGARRLSKHGVQNVMTSWSPFLRFASLAGAVKANQSANFGPAVLVCSSSCQVVGEETRRVLGYF